MKKTVHINEDELRNIIGESVRGMLKEASSTPENMTFKHCHITKHPLKDEYMVVNDTFPDIPPYFGSLRQCQKAAMHAEQSAEKLLNKLIDKARAEGHSEEEINQEVQRRLKRDFRSDGTANESMSEPNLRTIVESTYRALVNESMGKRIEEKRELVRSIVSEMVHRALKEGVKLHEETVDDDTDDLDSDNTLPDDDSRTPSPEEIAADRKDSEDYFANKYAKPKPERDYKEGTVINFRGHKIVKKDGIYVSRLGDDTGITIYSKSVNKLKENLEYIFSSYDPKEIAAKLKEYTETPYLCRPNETGNLEINLDGFGYPTSHARPRNADNAEPETYGRVTDIDFTITSAEWNKGTESATIRGEKGGRKYIWHTKTAFTEDEAANLKGKTMSISSAVTEPVEINGERYVMLTQVRRVKVS